MPTPADIDADYEIELARLQAKRDADKAKAAKEAADRAEVAKQAEEDANKAKTRAKSRSAKRAAVSTPKGRGRPPKVCDVSFCRVDALHGRSTEATP